jgi:hypothetical protein
MTAPPFYRFGVCGFSHHAPGSRAEEPHCHGVITVLRLDHAGAATPSEISEVRPDSSSSSTKRWPDHDPYDKHGLRAPQCTTPRRHQLATEEVAAPPTLSYRRGRLGARLSDEQQLRNLWERV